LPGYNEKEERIGGGGGIMTAAFQTQYF
jgi:hypothetical protein